MENIFAIISVLFLVVLASGCVSGGGGGEETGSITVKSLEVQPKEIWEGGNVRVSLGVANTGNLQGNISMGEKGSNILTNYCPDVFSPKRFTFQPSNIRKDGVIVLNPEREFQVQWNLEHIGNPELIEEQCRLEFDLPFNYSVSAYKQVQLKQSKEVSGSDKLQWESSSGPMVLAIQTIGSVSEDGQSTFITPGTEQGTPEENVPGNMTVLLQLQNPSGGSAGAGVIDVHADTLRVYATEPLELSEAFTSKSGLDRECGDDPTEPGWLICSKAADYEAGKEWSVVGDYSSGQMNAPKPRCDISGNELRVYEGKSRVIRCQVPIPEKIDSPGVVSEIRASVKYTYLKDAGSRMVKVKPRE